MSPQTTLKAQKRTITGRKVKNLRKQGILPANLFGNNITSQAIQIDTKDYLKVFSQAGETSLIDLEITGAKPVPVLISDYHIDPVTSAILHVDFHQVDLTQKVTANVPIDLIGESPAVKEQGGVLNSPLSEIEIEALPTDLLERIQVDISSLKNIGDMITVSQLTVDTSKVKLNAEPDAPVVMIQEPKVEEEPEPVAETPETEVAPGQEGETQPAAQSQTPAKPETPEPKQ